MSKLILIYFTLIFGVLFLLIPDSEPESYFPFSDMQLSFATHVYFICERISIIILAYVIASEARQYQWALKVFFYLTIFDLIDYVLHYNEVWFTFEGIPISMNILKATIFGSVIIREWSR